MRNTRPIAVLISDLHLSLFAPACRADKDWMEVQRSYLHQVRDLAYRDKGPLPVICAGDVFDKWNAPAELIHFALKELPDQMLAVPGQHDLPQHRLDLVHKSGFGVLATAGKIVDLSQPGHYIPPSCDFVASGFGWGMPIRRPPQVVNGIPKVAVIHRFCWVEGMGYPGAPGHLPTIKKELRGYDVALFGDNHRSFLAGPHPAGLDKAPCVVFNPGTFIRRKSDEIPFPPKIGILEDGGNVRTVPLDTTQDRFYDQPAKREEAAVDISRFIEGLKGLGEHGLDFRLAVARQLEGEDISEPVKKAIYECLEAAIPKN